MSIRRKQNMLVGFMIITLALMLVGAFGFKNAHAGSGGNAYATNPGDHIIRTSIDGFNMVVAEEIIDIVNIGIILKNVKFPIKSPDMFISMKHVVYTYIVPGQELIAPKKP